MTLKPSCSCGPLRLTATAYYNRFSNFIFQAATGEIEDDLPVFQYRQGKANYYGFEVEANAELGNAMGIHWDADFVADYVHARVKDFGPALEKQANDIYWAELAKISPDNIAKLKKLLTK